MAKSITIFNGSTGLNTKTDPTRLEMDQRSKVGELAIAVNVDIDDDGRVGRRKGYSSLLRTGCHSLFSAGNYMLGVLGGSLSVIERDGSTTALVAVNDDYRIRYVRLGQTVYFVNPEMAGTVTDRAYSQWTKADYVGPETDRQFYNPPAGQWVELHSGRAYIASGSVLWYSEPFAYGWFQLAKGFIPFPERITMVASVADGQWVCTANDAFFISGMNPDKDISLIKIPGAGAVEGAAVKIPGSRVGNGQSATEHVSWCGKSIFIGGPGGQLLDISGDKLLIPAANTGSAYYNDNRVVFCLNTY